MLFIIFALIYITAVCSVGTINFWGLIFAAVFLGLSAWIFPMLRKRFYDIDNRRLTIFFLSALGAMLTLQLVIGISAMFEPSSDLEIVDKAARTYVETGDITQIYQDIPNFNNYFKRYPNNNGIFLLLSLIYKITYSLTGTMPQLVPVIINTLFITASAALCFLITKKVFGNFHALVVMIICFMFLPYYTYCAYYYTDSLSMPFIILSIYLFICGYETNKLSKRILFMLLSGVSCAVGYELKGSAIIALAAVIIYMVYKKGLKKLLIGTTSLLVGFMVFAVLFGCIVSTVNISSEEESYKYEYPLTHWVMMGLKGNGNYNREDSKLTAHAGNYDEKKAANMEVINERISEYGLVGMIDHLSIKANFIWSDGTYYISHYITKPYNYNFLHDLLMRNGGANWLFIAVSSGMQLTMLLMLCVSFFSCIKKPRFDYITLMHIIVFGVYLFFMIWEARSRYIFNFTPIFIIVWANGIITLINRFQKPPTLRDKLNRSRKRLARTAHEA